MRRRAFLTRAFEAVAAVQFMGAVSLLDLFGPRHSVGQTFVLNEPLILRNGDHFEKCRFVKGPGLGGDVMVVVPPEIMDAYFCNNHLDLGGMVFGTHA